MPYCLKTDDRELLNKLRLSQVCAECGSRLEAFYDKERQLPYLQCKANPEHEGIARPASRYETGGLAALNIKTRREIMEQQFGKQQTTALERYHGVTSLTKEAAREILQTIYPDAPEVEMKRAVLLCATQGLNPLMRHVYLIKYQKWNKEHTKVIGETWSTVIGISAKRLMGSRRRAFSYIDNSPRLMTEEEQTKVFGKVDGDHLVAITVLQDPKTGAIARGYGKYPKNEKPYGTEKGNSQENMVFIRSESQAVDRLCPGEMPVGYEVVDEAFITEVTAESEGVIEGEGKELVEEAEPTTVPAAESATKEVTEPKHLPEEPKPNTVDALKEVMAQCNWSATDVGAFCNKEKVWNIREYKELKPKQIAEVIDWIKHNPK